MKAEMFVAQDEEKMRMANCIIAYTVGFEKCPIPCKELML